MNTPQNPGRRNNDQPPTPDPAGLEIARAVQDATQHATVILFGSRASGDHRPDSDVDLLLIADGPQAARDATAAVNRWLHSNKPPLDVNFRTMTSHEFQIRRRLGQSLAGQAARHGVNPMGERLEYSSDYDSHDEEIWQETRGWLERSEEHLQDYNEREDANHWNLKVMGYEAQQAVEHAMKGVLEAHGDQGRFRHDISRMWDYIEDNIPWRDDLEGAQGKQAIRELIDHVTFQDSISGQTFNWLTAFAEGYRYEIVPRDRTWDERKELQLLVNRAVAALEDEALHRRGAVRENLFPNVKPWERAQNPTEQ